MATRLQLLELLQRPLHQIVAAAPDLEGQVLQAGALDQHGGSLTMCRTHDLAQDLRHVGADLVEEILVQVVVPFELDL